MEIPRARDSRKPRLSFLRDCHFRFTRAGYFNDPFELKLSVYIDTYSMEDRDVARQEAVNSGISRPEQLCDDDIEGLFLSPFPAHRFDENTSPNLYPAILPELRQEPFHSIAEIDEFRIRKVQEGVQRIMNRAYGILSLSEDPTSITMWSHYGAEHRGICVGFNPKYWRWQEEKEWRLIVPSPRCSAEGDPLQTADSFFLLPFPESTISAVILGSRVTSDEEAEVISLLANAQWRHIKLFRAIQHEREYSLEFKEVVRSEGSS